MKWGEYLSSSAIFHSFGKDRILSTGFVSALLLNGVSWALLIWQTEDLYSLKALHYNIYFGIDWLGPWYQVFIVPLTALVFLAIDYYLSWFYYEQYRLLSYLFAAAGTFVQLLCLIASSLIVWINLV